MQMWNIAWRNVWRRRRRTLITGFSIGFGVLLAAIFTGMAIYMYGNMINASAATGFGHVTFEPIGYSKAPALDKRLSRVDTLREQIVHENGVDAAMERIMGQAMFATASKTVGGMFLAINPQHESAEYNLLIRSLVEGKVFSDKNAGGVVIGKRLAEKLNLRIGKKLVYTTTDVNGEIVSEIARVSGLFVTGVDEIDGGMALFPLRQIQHVLGYHADEATLIAVMLRQQRHAESSRDVFRQKYHDPSIEILSWQQTQPDLAGMITIDAASNYVMQFLIALLIAAGILNTMLMSVLERTREFGVMLAIGLSPKRLFWLVMAESYWMALIGLVIGIVITSPFYWYFDVYGLDFSSLLGDESYTVSNVLIDPVIRMKLHVIHVIAILSAVFGLALLSGIYPAWRAGRVPPVESLRTI